MRDSGLPDAWIGAGALRDLIRGERYGDGFDQSSVRDVDVVFLDAADLSRENDDRATARLVAASSELPWEAKNQAARAHLIPGEVRRGPAHLCTITDAVATSPEYATAVAVRLDAYDQLAVCAPRGLDDLLDGVWRRIPNRVSPEISRQRLARLQSAAEIYDLDLERLLERVKVVRRRPSRRPHRRRRVSPPSAIRAHRRPWRDLDPLPLPSVTCHAEVGPPPVRGHFDRLEYFTPAGPF